MLEALMDSADVPVFDQKTIIIGDPSTPDDADSVNDNSSSNLSPRRRLVSIQSDMMARTPGE